MSFKNHKNKNHKNRVPHKHPPSRRPPPERKLPQTDPFLEELHAIRSDVGRKIDPMNASRDTAVVMRAYDLPESFP